MKAVLVIDVPDDFETKTAIAIVDVKNEEGEGVTAMCPLKPMPTKKKPLFDPDHCEIEKEIKIAHEIVGYNRCIDEIEGETE